MAAPSSSAMSTQIHSPRAIMSPPIASKTVPPLSAPLIPPSIAASGSSSSSASPPPSAASPGVATTIKPAPTVKSPYAKEKKAARKTMRAPSQRKGPPPPKYMFFPRHHSQTNPNPSADPSSSNNKSTEIDLLRCNIWQRDSTTQVRWGSVQTGWIKPPPDADVTDSCRRSDIVCAVNGSERVVASLFWRNGFLSSVVVQGKEAIVHREEYKHIFQAAPIGFSWPDGHRFFTWVPVDGQDDVSGVMRNGNTCASVHPSVGYVVVAPVFASYERVEILLLGVILARYKRGLLNVEGKDDEQFEQGGLVWADAPPS